MTVPPLDPELSADSNPGGNRDASDRDSWLKSLWEAIGASPKMRAFDWRAKVAGFTVRDQGTWQCCTSFAFAAMVEARRSIAGHSPSRLSAGFIPYCLLGIRNPDQRCNAEIIAEQAKSTGHKSGAIDGLPLSDCGHSPGELIRIAGARYGPLNAAAADLMVAKGPLLLELRVPKAFFDLGPHTIYDFDPAGGGAIHSVLMVGYDWPAKTVTILNSGGNRFGNDGFATLTLRAAQLHNRNPFDIDLL